MRQRRKKLWFGMSGILAVLALALMLPTGAAAGTYRVLHRFKGSPDGAFPTAGLIFDAAGNLYGMTPYGGNPNDCQGAAQGAACGVVFKLTPKADGSWTESVLHTFSGGSDGAEPQGGLIFDAAGNLYGTTYYGGNLNDCHGNGCGVVFRLAPKPDGGWTESVLHRFHGRSDGANPMSGVIFDAAGNLYGTTSDKDASVVFKLQPNSDGSWTENVLFSFAGTSATNGHRPLSGLIFDTAGSLYGTTFGGGENTECFNCGTVFKVSPNSDGSWTESVLNSFTGSDGSGPYAGLIFDATGNLYGTTSSGGNLNECHSKGCGVVFKLTPNADGSWTETVLFNFSHDPAANPHAALAFDAMGNLYGTAADGGPVDGGLVFKLKSFDGIWWFGVVHVFEGKPGANPGGSLVFDKAGNLYGTTETCGSGCDGVVFEITP